MLFAPPPPRGPHSASVLPLRRGLRRRRKSRRAAGWFLAAELTGQYGSPPAVGYGPPIPPRPSNGLGAVVTPPALPAHWRTQSYSGGTKKRSKKTTKVVQSAYCEVCKVNCTCEEDLNSHKQGKKHISSFRNYYRSLLHQNLYKSLLHQNLLR
ncbi:putative zinc finger RNA-binding protein [Iris pallida]|uniref:Zinc finger RNA-binding protein n=1 Tax=Iris pallida TaxID=29817 RepID=A0AAX6DRP0_IRIPA|nr:putative zinc finger RNA-binding protein [Iris pallida]